ncbi:hypothetical protein ACFSFZ_15250 [Mixta tenebrionis]|uniref:Uncharacterized protein n=1 Tax=Mixta tenebrionis TaxID=2562439 RepID=A0A506VCV8_9GAMM|nr:hypothetical protein [Mixta tenebrionis]TPW43352.1 hypothetical protein FKM52_07275 [Mixta tenebrionis]
MWLQMSEAEQITHRTPAELADAMQSGRLLWRIAADGQVEIELSTILRAFSGEQAGAIATDNLSRRLQQQWEQLWQRRETY